MLNGLYRLEYRGYDSAGIALINEKDELNIYKVQGKVAKLEELGQKHDISGQIGIGHTRWATHGVPNDINAHPHLSKSRKIALVHNGTIENYRVLKEVLADHGYECASDTDTEVMVQLIDFIQQNNGCTLLEAVREALQQVVGAYAIAVIHNDNPDELIVARKSSPLVIGLGKNEKFIASDASPIVGYADKVIYLQDNEIAVVRRQGNPQIFSLTDNKKSTCTVQKLQMSVEQLEKGGYDTFMQKEIFEQPTTLEDCIRGRISKDGRKVILSGVIDNKERFLNANRIVIVACGTSWHAALIGKRLMQDMCHIPVEVEYASEFRYSNPVITDKDIIIAISQSGETADTLAAVQLGREQGAFVYGICNVIGASIPRNTDSGTYIHVGPEIGVASTKAFTGQVTALVLLAICIGQVRDSIDEDYAARVIESLRSMPSIIKETLKLDNRIADLAKRFTFAHNFLYLGRGYNYPTALEGALKLKEISYIHAEGYPAAEMKHGPIALIDNEMPTVIIAPNDSMYDKIVSNVQQVKSRGGTVIAVVNRGNSSMDELADFCIEIPEVPECLTPIVASIPLQLLAYHIAVCKNRNVDQPRNLAKAVTVE